MSTGLPAMRIPILMRLLFAAGLWLSAQLPVHAGGFEFEPRMDLRWAGGAFAVSTADFNGDGRDDMAVIQHGYFEVLLQDASGTLGSPVRYGEDGVFYLTVSHADIDADGVQEILLGHAGGLTVYRWNGTGLSIENHPSANACWFMASADLDADGRSDVLCHGRDGDASIYYSAPTGHLGAPVYMQTSAHWPRFEELRYVTQARLKDVTGDDKPDLLLAANTSSTFFVYPHDGVRGFLPGTSYSYPPGYHVRSGSVEAVDLDGDGANEVIVTMPCNTPCAAILVYKQDATGHLALSRTLATHDIPRGLLAYDFDGNGYQDLLVGHSGWMSVGLYKGSANGLSQGEHRFQVPVGAFPEGYSLGDLNHDGYMDLAVANSFGISLMYGRPGHPIANDLDGDYVSDVLWRRVTGANVAWLSADSTTTQTIGFADPAWQVQATGDFDGDGVGEVFLRNTTTGANQLREAGSAPTTITAVSNRDWQVVGAGDFDGDGQSDLLWRNARNGANVIWKSAHYKRQQSVRGVTDLRWQVAGVGDFDRDGRADILWRHATSGRNAIWRSAHFRTLQPIRAVTNIQWQVQGIGDFNDDGADDIVWRNVGTGMNTIWLSADYGNQQGVVAVTNTNWTIAAVGDYDGDGVSDLFWRDEQTGSNTVWFTADRDFQRPEATVNSMWNVVR